MATLKEALDDRFDCIEECRDVMNHGCSGGVTGFIYYVETSEFYDLYSDEIEEILYDIGYIHNFNRDDTVSIKQLKNAAVWAVVEYYCSCRVGDYENEHEGFIDDYMDDEDALASAGYIDG